jgi:hypothetical protein
MSKDIDPHALLFFLLSEIAMWAVLQRPEPELRDACSTVVNEVNKRLQHNDNGRYEARDLVRALASPNHLGLVAALEDIKNGVNEVPPTQPEVRDALEAWLRHPEDCYEAQKVLRAYLNAPRPSTVHRTA